VTSATSFDAVATLVQRLAVLTAAGISPLSAWRHAGAADDVAAAIARQADSAHDLSRLIGQTADTRPEAQQSAWRTLSALWAVATEAGAPLAPTLERSAEVLRSLSQSSREVDAALAGPQATSRIVLTLPAVGVVLGALLGFDLIAALTSPAGLVCVSLGGILTAVAVRWNRRLLRWAREIDATPGVEFDLYAIALAGGASIERATAMVARACQQARLVPTGNAVQPVLQFARDAGVPVVGLLRAEADERRRSSRAEAAGRAARLETRMLLPLGLCVLPAFVLVGVVPIGLAVLSSTVGGI